MRVIVCEGSSGAALFGIVVELVVVIGVWSDRGLAMAVIGAGEVGDVGRERSKPEKEKLS